MYCTVQDVESYFYNRTFGCEAGAYLTVDKVRGFIINEAAFIDAKIGVLYTLPITITRNLVILKMINEKLVVGTIDDIDRQRTDDGKFDRSRNMRKEALDLLQQIIDGEIILNSEDGSPSAVLKFNNIDSRGNEVVKRFSNSNIEPTTVVCDREHHRSVGCN